jgi:hypothetical protein
MTTDINYGTKLKSSDMAMSPTFTEIGEAQTQSFPKIVTDSIEYTNHSSGSVRQKMPSGLQSMDEFTAKYNMTAAVLGAMYDDLVAGTIRDYKIENTGDLADFTFSAFVKGLKPGNADAQTPDILSVEITFRPTGAIGGMV